MRGKLLGHWGVGTMLAGMWWGFPASLQVNSYWQQNRGLYIPSARAVAYENHTDPIARSQYLTRTSGYKLSACVLYVDSTILQLI